MSTFACTYVGALYISLHQNKAILTFKNTYIPITELVQGENVACTPFSFYQMNQYLCIKYMKFLTGLLKNI